MALDRIIVCDDDDKTRDEFVAAINVAIGRESANNHTAKDLKDAITALLQGREGTLFDEADVAVIDNRLIDEWTDEADPKISAEQLSDLVRTGSTAKSVVILNQYREIDFDLRLDGRLESFADLNITDVCLPAASLWVDVEPTGFRPWSWPVLDRLVDQQASRMAWLLEEDGRRLNEPVLTALGLGTDRLERSLSRVAADFLHPEKNPSEVTFLDFVRGATRATDRKDRTAVAENRELAAKIAASRLGKWLEAAVLGPQDLLVDVPHLIERFPCLAENHRSIESWNGAISWSAIKGFRSEFIADHVWPHWEMWLARPAYIWPAIQDDDDLGEKLIACLGDAAPAEASFCEDVSRFLPSEDTREFVASFDSNFDRRRVTANRPPGFTYGPANRLAR